MVKLGSVSTTTTTTWKKYKDNHYDVVVDPIQGDKAREIKLYSFRSPHMCAFHMSWMGLFAANFVWCSITPLLLSEIQKDLQLTHTQIWNTSIAGMVSTVGICILLGPLCDHLWGPRVLFSFVLCLSSIQVACIGLIQTYEELLVLRFFIGMAGGCFVTNQYWTSTMFCKSLVGTANALVAGWGNVGMAASHLMMGSVLFPWFQTIFQDTEQAWRFVFVIPAIGAFLIGICMYQSTDDCPKGNYSEMIHHGGVTMPSISFLQQFHRAIFDHNTWILLIQYACCSGVELIMNHAATIYFFDEFDQSTESAATLASIFGWMNLFARGMGGLFSDRANSTMGTKGRLWVQLLFLLTEGVCVLYFGRTKTLTSSMIVMIFLAITSQAAQGSTYGIVPQIDPPTTGAISGIVGAGGPFGAIMFAVCFRQLNYIHAFTMMGFSILGAATLTVLVNIRGCSRIFGGADYVWDMAPSVFVFIP